MKFAFHFVYNMLFILQTHLHEEIRAMHDLSKLEYTSPVPSLVVFLEFGRQGIPKDLVETYLERIWDYARTGVQLGEYPIHVPGGIKSRLESLFGCDAYDISIKVNGQMGVDLGGCFFVEIEAATPLPLLNALQAADYVAWFLDDCLSHDPNSPGKPDVVYAEARYPGEYFRDVSRARA